MDKQTILIGIALLFVLGVVNIVYSSYFQIEEVKIQGNELLTDKYLLNFSKLNQKDNLFAIDQEKIEEKITELSQIKSATVRRDFPNQVVVQIKERMPLAVIPFQSSYQVIDAAGWILQVTNNLSSWQLPLLTGFAIDNQEEKNQLTAELEVAINYLSKLPKNVLAGISEVHLTDQQKIRLFLHQDATVKLGSDFDIKRKAQVFTSIYQDLQQKDLDIEYIDLRYKENSFLKLD
ncbi:cell division protein FtsQ/DivIB [Halanaerobaculum tunisiense]